MTMEPSECSVQKKPEKPAQKKRKPEERHGRWRYTHRRLDRIEKTQKEELSLLRVITRSLAPFLEIEGDELREIVCTDEIDIAILDLLQAKGTEGVSVTKAVDSEQLCQYRLKHYHVTRRIQRMDKRMKDRLGRRLIFHSRRNYVLSSLGKKTLGSETAEL